MGLSKNCGTRMSNDLGMPPIGSQHCLHMVLKAETHALNSSKDYLFNAHLISPGVHCQRLRFFPEQGDYTVFGSELSEKGEIQQVLF